MRLCMTSRKIINAFLVASILICSVGCNKTVPMSEQLVSVFDKYKFSSTISSVNLDSGGYYTTDNVPEILYQPSSVVADYIMANKRIPNTASLTITYAEFNNEVDTNNTFETMQTEIKDKLSESGTGYYDNNLIIGFYIPVLGTQDEYCLYYLLYRSGTKIVYVFEQGPVSFVDQNQDLVNEICQTVGFDPSEKYNTIRKSMDE